MFVSYACNLLLTSRVSKNSSTFRVAFRTCGLTKAKMTTKTKLPNPAPRKLPVTRFVSIDLNNDNSANDDDVQQKDDINFEDHVQAFRRKSTWEIARALCVLRMCAINAFVDNSLPIMNWTKQMLGSRGLRVFFKPMFYKQFVGGESHKEIHKCLRKLNETGIRPMLAAAMEEDIGQDGSGNEEIYNSNCSRILECLEIASVEETPSPMMQLKISALLPANLLVRLGDIYTPSDDKLNLIKAVAQGLTSDDLQVDSLDNVLDDREISLFRNALCRLRKIGQEAQFRRVKVLVDAEYTYFNPGISFLTMAMAAEYNQKSPEIWNTYQCYLKDAQSKVCEELDLADQLNVFFGAKVVRGAYMVQERERARTLQIPDPVCADYKATNDNYNALLEFLLDYTKKWPKCVFMVASHNEESIVLAIQKMKELGIDNQNGGVCFGQLYGMCDQITYPLALSDYAVYKSIPYGTVDEVLPYLARRATENKTVLEGTRKEQYLLWKEMKHRLSLKRGRRNNI